MLEPMMEENIKEEIKCVEEFHLYVVLVLDLRGLI
jgi:hypothetical protein